MNLCEHLGYQKSITVWPKHGQFGQKSCQSCSKIAKMRLEKHWENRRSEIFVYMKIDWFFFLWIIQCVLCLPKNNLYKWVLIWTMCPLIDKPMLSNPYITYSITSLDHAVSRWSLEIVHLGSKRHSYTAMLSLEPSRLTVWILKIGQLVHSYLINTNRMRNASVLSKTWKLHLREIFWCNT